VARGLLLSYGLRYEAQTIVEDQQNFSPRVTVTWSPFKSGRTTLRGGFGMFNDWIGVQTYEQIQRFDGFRQQEVNVVDPSFPDAGAGVIPPTNRYTFSNGLRLPESRAMNAGIDQQLNPALRFNATYTHRLGSQILRGRNLNATVDGVRPDARFANVVEVVGDAGARFHSLTLALNFIKLEWRQTFLAMNYSLTSSETNSTGAFGLPANADQLSAEWGVTLPRHRFGATFNMRPTNAFGVAVNVRAQSGSPYNITTGLDDNADGVFSDRPAGVARNAARTAAQWVEVVLV
jgi:hypothetical protein